MPYRPRNSFLVPGINRLTRSQAWSKKASRKRKKVAVSPSTETAKATKTKTAKATKTKTIGGLNNGGQRVIPIKKALRFYPAEDVPKRKVSRKTMKPTPLRSTITPGTILILLSGRFRGKRVVFLKQLKSGLLLVTGPFKVNGVPLRRINQAYAIATSTKIDISGVKIDEKFNDKYFKKAKDYKKKVTEENFFEGEKKKEAFPKSKAADQKALDKVLLEQINKVPQLRSYLNASFSLHKGEFPHALKF